MYTHNNYSRLNGDGQVKPPINVNDLINKYKVAVYNLCFKLTLNRSDADDLFQETWLKAAKSVNNVDKFYYKQWLFRVCINQYKDNCRKEKRRKNVFYEFFDSSSTKDFVLENTNYSLSAEEEYESKIAYEQLISHINQLPKKLKIPIVLFYFEQMKYAEIATILKIPVGTIKSRLNAAKKKLQEELKGENNV